MLLNTDGIVRIHTKEMRFLTNGTALLKMNVVSSEKYKEKEDVCWVELVAFGKQAETIDKFFSEKDRIYIKGKLKQDTWETPEGQKRSKHTIQIDSFEFIEKRDNQSQQPRQEPEVVHERQSVPEIDINDDIIPF